MNKLLILAAAALLAGCAQQQNASEPIAASAPTGPIEPVLATEPVGSDADDPAIWIHPTDPAKSLVVGTDKEYEIGGLYVFDLDGKVVQKISPLDRPNNVDVEYGFQLGDREVDLAVATERGPKRLRIFAIDRETGTLTDVGGETAVFTDREGEQAAPMGISLYKRPLDGTIFAIVGSKEGPAEGYLYQYKLMANDGKVDIEFVRAFGAFSGTGEIEAIGVDDEIGTVYYADEGYGVRKYPADPDDTDAGVALGEMGLEGYTGDREGIGIVAVGGPGQGYVLSVDQIEGGSAVMVYPRDRVQAAPLIRLDTIADDTDGLDATPTALGPKFPNGLVVMMNSKDKNFLFFDWKAFSERLPKN